MLLIHIWLFARSGFQYKNEIKVFNIINNSISNCRECVFFFFHRNKLAVCFWFAQTHFRWIVLNWLKKHQTRRNEWNYFEIKWKWKETAWVIMISLSGISTKYGKYCITDKLNWNEMKGANYRQSLTRHVLIIDSSFIKNFHQKTNSMFITILDERKVFHRPKFGKFPRTCSKLFLTLATCFIVSFSFAAKSWVRIQWGLLTLYLLIVTQSWLLL